MFLWVFGASCGLALLYCLNPCLRLRLSGTAAPTQNLTETLPVHLDRGTVHTEETLRAVSVYFPLVSLCSLYFDVLVKHIAECRLNSVKLSSDHLL